MRSMRQLIAFDNLLYMCVVLFLSLFLFIFLHASSSVGFVTPCTPAVSRRGHAIDAGRQIYTQCVFSSDSFSDSSFIHSWLNKEVRKCSDAPPSLLLKYWNLTLGAAAATCCCCCCSDVYSGHTHRADCKKKVTGWLRATTRASTVQHKHADDKRRLYRLTTTFLSCLFPLCCWHQQQQQGLECLFWDATTTIEDSSYKWRNDSTKCHSFLSFLFFFLLRAK